MSNSNLVDKTILTSHKYNGRGGNKIEKIVVHHMAGVMSIEQCGRVFKSREASAHYGIGSDGRIGQYVREENTAWACGSRYWNQRTVSIEVSNSTGASGGWKVSDKALEACIKLVADIASRNGIKQISFTGNTAGNLIQHRYVASTACPGPYLAKKFPYIASEANKLMGYKPKPNSVIKKGQHWLGTTEDGILSGQHPADAEAIPALTDCCEWTGTGESEFVHALQRKLNSCTGAGLSVDGYMGHSTVKALQRYLVKAGKDIAIDGSFGPATLKAFSAYLADPVEVKISVTKTTGQKLVDQLEAMEKQMRNWSYSNKGADHADNWSGAKKKKKTNCATFVSWGLQNIGVLKSGDLFYCNKKSIHTQRGQAAAHLKAKATVTYPNKSPKNCNLKVGDICGYTTHTQVFAGWDANGHSKWYSMGGSDIGKNLPRVKSDYNSRKIEVLIRLK